VLTKATKFAALLLILSSGLPALAQQDPAADLDAFRNDMAERLKMTDQQKADAEPHLVANFERLAAIREQSQSGDLSRFGAISEARSSRSELDEQLSKILDENQLRELQEMRSEQKAELRKRIGERRRR
jgi:hypothetical protein